MESAQAWKCMNKSFSISFPLSVVTKHCFFVDRLWSPLPLLKALCNDVLIRRVYAQAAFIFLTVNHSRATIFPGSKQRSPMRGERGRGGGVYIYGGVSDMPVASLCSSLLSPCPPALPVTLTPDLQPPAPPSTAFSVCLFVEFDYVRMKLQTITKCNDQPTPDHIFS